MSGNTEILDQNIISPDINNISDSIPNFNFKYCNINNLKFIDFINTIKVIESQARIYINPNGLRVCTSNDSMLFEAFLSKESFDEWFFDSDTEIYIDVDINLLSKIFARFNKSESVFKISFFDENFSIISYNMPKKPKITKTCVKMFCRIISYSLCIVRKSKRKRKKRTKSKPKKKKNNGKIKQYTLKNIPFENYYNGIVNYKRFPIGHKMSIFELDIVEIKEIIEMSNLFFDEISINYRDNNLCFGGKSCRGDMTWEIPNPTQIGNFNESVKHLTEFNLRNFAMIYRMAIKWEIKKYRFVLGVFNALVIRHDFGNNNYFKVMLRPVKVFMDIWKESWGKINTYLYKTFRTAINDLLKKRLHHFTNFLYFCDKEIDYYYIKNVENNLGRFVANLDTEYTIKKVIRDKPYIVEKETSTQTGLFGNNVRVVIPKKRVRKKKTDSKYKKTTLFPSISTTITN
jgi:hypothetical protein